MQDNPSPEAVARRPRNAARVEIKRNAIRTQDAQRQGILVLDSLGEIALCNVNAAQIFGYETGSLLRKPVSFLIPTLPLRSATPGYNLAFAHFWPREAWRNFHGRDASGVLFPLEISLRSTRLNSQRAIALDLRQSSQGNGR